ncbi:MAG: pitrilysin family protein, partial [Acidobacteria bacterium]|nr:pitrilysin family protein [Acidobacteriota bacterium]
AFTSKELVSYNTKVLDEHLPVAFYVLSDLVLNPVFREEDVEKEKGVILEELKMEEDNPEYLAHETFVSSFWKGQPLGRPILGTKHTIKSFNPDRVRQYFSKVYAPGNICITAAGHLEHDHMVRLARERFESLPTNGFSRESTRTVAHPSIVLKSKKSLEQVHLCLGVPAYAVAHELRFACYALNTLLGGGMSSRLFQNIRERRGLAYSVFSELSLYRDTGCLLIYAGTSAESVRKVVELVMEEFRILKNELVPEEELRRAKDYLKGSLMLGLESTSSRMGNLARQEMFFNRFFSLDELVQSMEAVTADQMQSIAQDFFRPESVAVTVLGNLEDLKLEREDLNC